MFLLVQCLVKPTEQQQCIVYRDSYLFFAVVLILVLFKPQWMISQKYSKARNLFQRTNLRRVLGNKTQIVHSKTEDRGFNKGEDER